MLSFVESMHIGGASKCLRRISWMIDDGISEAHAAKMTRKAISDRLQTNIHHLAQTLFEERPANSNLKEYDRSN
jgi:hypothetical protein